MISSIFQNGERIIVQVMQWSQIAWQTVFKNRTTDYSQAGICKGELAEFAITVGNNNVPAFPSVNISGGIGYDPFANRIFIASTDTTTFNSANPSQTTDDGTGFLVPTPQSTGCINVPLNTNVINYLWIDYLGTINTSLFTLQDVTLAKQFYEQLDGYRISVTTGLTPIPPDANSVFLGSVNLTSAGIVSSATISQAARIYSANLPYRTLIETPALDKSDVTTVYTLGGTYFADDHTKAIGSGTVSPTNPHGLAPQDIGISPAATVQEHQRIEHTDGVIGTTATLQAQIIVVTPGLDYLTIAGLSSTEFAVVNGVTITSLSIPVTVTVLFSGGDPNGVWYVYVDQFTQSIQKTQLNIALNPDPTKLLIYSVVWTFPGTGGGDLSNLVDYRQIGSISEKNVQDSLAAWIFSQIDECNQAFEFCSYFTSGVDNGSLATYNLYGTDAQDREENLLGTVTYTNGSTAVLGTGTDFQFRLNPGDGIMDQSRLFLGRVASVTDQTDLVLVDPWAGPTETVVGVKVKYRVTTTFSYQNDPVYAGTRRLASSSSVFRFGSTSFVRNSIYTYDGNDNLITIASI